MEGAYHAVIDYRAYIEEQARGFSGRALLLAALSEWLADTGGPRFFAIVGPPGSGKTALAARIAQIAMGAAAPPPGAPQLTAGFLSAVHFCPASDLRWNADRRWFQPRVFAESVSRQLAARYPRFAEALVRQSARGRITVSATQQVDQNSGTLIGVSIGRLDLGGLSAEDAFSDAVREPLEAMRRTGPMPQVTLLIDALDEALAYRERPNIVSLITQVSSLAPEVRFIVTARYGVDELADLTPAEVAFHRLDEEPYDAESMADIAALVRAQAAGLAPRLRGVTLDELAERVVERSQGNYLYATQLGAVLGARPSIDRALLDTLPAGLSAFYRAFLRRATEQSGLPWESELQPPLGTLAVAQEALRRTLVAGVVGRPTSKLIPALRAARPVLDLDDALAESQRTYSLYHRSFADFLLDEDEAQEYWCEAGLQHERLADYCAQRVEDAAHPYARRYAALHRAEAALASPQPARHQHAAALAALALGPGFEQLRLAEDGPAAYRADLERTLRTLAADAHPETPPLLLAAAARLLRFHESHLRPEPIFAHARAGRLTESLALLAMLPAEAKWQQAAQLTIAWCAQGAAPPAEVETLIAPVAQSPGLPAPLPELLALARGGPAPPGQLVYAPDPEAVRAIIARAGGAGAEPLNISEQLQGYVSSGGIVTREEVIRAAASSIPEPVGEHISYAAPADADPRSIFMSAFDGPLLVAYAAQPGLPAVERDAPVDQYIDLQAANSYVRYRNGSLWALLDAILRHGDPDWVRERVVRLVTGALAGSHIEYQEGVPLTLLALRARGGDAAAAARLDAISGSAEAAAAMLSQTRHRNDTTGQHTRRMAALAQAHALLLGRPDRAAALLDRALRWDVFGYAGLYAPAALTLAEAAGLCAPGDAARSGQALAKARRSAHRVQESAFCAQTTARVNALGIRWWPRQLGAAALRDTIRAFHADPGDAPFSALHLRGEGYGERPGYDPDQLPIAEWVRDAKTLPQLAEVYERPLAELERVNPGDDGARPEVSVPDPAFAPLLAAYLAAAALGSTALPPAGKVELIQLLVPAAAASPTALDTVLARLLIAAAAAGWVTPEALDQIDRAGYPTQLIGSIDGISSHSA